MHRPSTLATASHTHNIKNKKESRREKTFLLRMTKQAMVECVKMTS